MLMHKSKWTYVDTDSIGGGVDIFAAEVCALL